MKVLLNVLCASMLIGAAVTSAFVEPAQASLGGQNGALVALNITR